MRTVVGRLVTTLGFTPAFAGNGKEALAVLRDQGAHDLALVDWNMPEMNGIEFLAAVRADHSYATMPLVMVTTETEPNQMARAMALGASGYVTKPFSGDSLRTRLTELGLLG